MDFSYVKRFKLLRHLGKAYDIAFAGVSMDEKRSYDYISDTYQKAGARVLEPTPVAAPQLSRLPSTFTKQQIEAARADAQREAEVRARAITIQANQLSRGPTLGIAGSRRTAEMKYLTTIPLAPGERVTSNYTENMFESRALGIGMAFERDAADAERERRKGEVLILKLPKIKPRRANALSCDWISRICCSGRRFWPVVRPKRRPRGRSLSRRSRRNRWQRPLRRMLRFPLVRYVSMNDAV